MKQIILFWAVFIMVSCQQLKTFSEPIPIDNTFDYKPASADDLKKYRLAADFLESRKGKAILVIKGNTIVFEEYQNGHSAEIAQHIWSGTKGFTGAMGMCAVNDGLIDLDEKIADTLPTFKSDPLKSQITVRHLMNFSSGLEQSFMKLSRDMMVEKQSIPDKYAYALTLSAEEAPDTNFSYGGIHHFILGAFLKKKLQQDPLEYMQKKIFDPIGFRYAGWYKDLNGNPGLPFGCWTTAREWAKFGILMRDDGAWQGKQIIPKGVLSQCIIPSKLMPAFGFGFWLNEEVPFKYRKNLIPQLRTAAWLGRVMYNNGPKDLFCAAGHLGNRCYVIPSQDIVIIVLGSKAYGDFDRKFLKRILDGKVW